MPECGRCGAVSSMSKDNLGRSAGDKLGWEGELSKGAQACCEIALEVVNQHYLSHLRLLWSYVGSPCLKLERVWIDFTGRNYTFTG